MDAIQFGRWLHKRRRECGFSSQRALVERVQQDTSLRQQGISEAFLARLETGQLVHPFRGAVRRRVVALTEVICRTPHDVTAYLRAAEIKELDNTENAVIARLRARLSQPQARLLHLPMRHQPVFGRAEITEKLLSTLRHENTNVVFITGMAGVGKSTLAAEVAHSLVDNSDGEEQIFRDGIISFSCTGYRGNKGLLALCEHILALFETAPVKSSIRKSKDRLQAVDFAQVSDVNDAIVHKAMNQVRLRLTNHSLLILLDDLDAKFPLRLVLEMLGSQKRETHFTILVTSRYQFASFSSAYCVHLEPLSSPAALDYLAFLRGYCLCEEEQEIAKSLCAAVGYLPSALETLATLCKAGISLGALHETLLSHSLTPLLEYDEELSVRIRNAFTLLSKEEQQLFSLLTLINVPSIGLEAIAALSANRQDKKLASYDATELLNRDDKSRVSLADTALVMSQLTRHSLVDLHTQPNQQNRYQLHPILKAYGRHLLQELPQEDCAVAQENLRGYALGYIEQHRGDIRHLLRERDLLFACCTEALQAERYADVMQFVTGLAPISCRLNTRKDGTSLFHWGIQASGQLHDIAQQVRFIHYYGWLCFQRGAFDEAKQAWLEALAKTEDASLQYWQPLLSLAQLARLQHEATEAERFVERYLFAARNSATPQNYAYAHILLALYQRLQHKRDVAYQTLDVATHILTSLASVQQHDLYCVMQKLLNIEQARVRGKYEQAQAETETLATVLEQKEEQYDAADLLLEQVVFAQGQQQWEQVPNMLYRSMEAANKVDATYLHALGLQMAQKSFQAGSLSSKHPYLGVSQVGPN